MHIFESPRVEKSLTVLLWIVSLFIIMLGLNAAKEYKYIGGGVPVSNTISVSGEGESFAVPDIAQFSFSIVEERVTVEEAQAEATLKSNEIVEFLKSEGIDDKDMRTTGYNVNPRYEWRTATDGIGQTEIFPPQPDRTRVLMGYEVQQSMTVKVREIDAAGDALAGVGSLGASNVSGLSFTIDDEDAVQDEARAKAIAKAKEKAKDLARELGVSLVRVVNFSEGGSPYQRQYFAPEAMSFDSMAGIGGSAPSIEPGENRVVSTVTITYEIR